MGRGCEFFFWENFVWGSRLLDGEYDYEDIYFALFAILDE